MHYLNYSQELGIALPFLYRRSCHHMFTCGKQQQQTLAYYSTKCYNSITINAILALAIRYRNLIFIDFYWPWQVLQRLLSWVMYNCTVYIVKSNNISMTTMVTFQSDFMPHTLQQVSRSAFVMLRHHSAGSILLSGCPCVWSYTNSLLTQYLTD